MKSPQKPNHAGGPQSDTELDDLIRSANPSPGASAWPVTTPWARVTAPSPEPTRLPRRRRLIVFPIAGALVVGAAGATYAALSDGEVSSVQSVHCAADMGGDVMTGANADGRDPATLCAGLWSAGEVAAGQHSVPKLQACLVDGSVTVYPAADACFRLDLPVAAPYSETNQDAIWLSRAVLPLLKGCHDLPDARRVVTQAVTDRGLDWPVTTDDSVVGTQTCVAAEVRPDRTVRLVPLHGGPAFQPQSNASPDTAAHDPATDAPTSAASSSAAATSPDGNQVPPQGP